MSNAFDEDTAPTLAQVVPSVEYCQVPFPLFAVIAIPFSGLASTSAQDTVVNIELAVIADEVVSSLVPVNVTVAPLVIVGESLTELTVIATLSESSKFKSDARDAISTLVRTRV